jgi:hypothetical protein
MAINSRVAAFIGVPRIPTAESLHIYVLPNPPSLWKRVPSGESEAIFFQEKRDQIILRYTV